MPLSVLDAPLESQLAPLTAANLDPFHGQATGPASQQATKRWLEEQKSHSGLYASQGEDYISLWKRLDCEGADSGPSGGPSNRPTVAPKSSDAMPGAFTTPVLKPRTLRLLERETKTSALGLQLEPTNNNPCTLGLDPEPRMTAFVRKSTPQQDHPRTFTEARARGSQKEQNTEKENVDTDDVDYEQRMCLFVFR